MNQSNNEYEQKEEYYDLPTEDCQHFSSLRQMETYLESLGTDGYMLTAIRNTIKMGYELKLKTEKPSENNDLCKNCRDKCKYLSHLPPWIHCHHDLF